MNYKHTISLPKTTFPMKPKAGSDVAQIDKWIDPYHIMQQQRMRSEKDFVLHDGPPYANGDIHMGHALNKILKDFVVKYHYFSGDRVHYVPGWDCHGLPIEKEVMKQIRGGNSPEVTEPANVRRMCQEYAEKQVLRQMEQFQSLGVVADWSERYQTMDHSFETTTFKRLAELAGRGHLVRRDKPVLWSYAFQTALAEAEVVYKDATDTSVYVAFTIAPDLALLVWTTTPWTLPANAAVALNPNTVYEAMTIGDKKYIVAAELVDRLAQKFGLGKNISRMIDVQHPSFPNLACNPINPERRVPIVFDEFVTTNVGTGCVHIAPGHGVDDYNVGLKNNLPMIQPVDPMGRYTSEVVDLVGGRNPGLGLHGEFVFDANEVLIEAAKENGTLVHVEKYTHSYPFCQRSDTPVIFRATPNWFLKLEGCKDFVCEELSKAKFVPPAGMDRLKTMIANRDEWCLSRQRVWGTPIAFFMDEDGKPILDNDILNHVAKMFDEYGCDCWWTAPDEFFLPPHRQHLVGKIERCQETLDVWFDSGLTWTVLPHQHANVYLEGNDQYRGWFNSSSVLGCFFTNTVPFDECIVHGFVVDQKGHKMSKSKGNVISPEKVLKKYHVDMLRTWVAMTDYIDDIRLSNETLDRAKDAYLKIRNTLRYLVANIGEEYTNTLIMEVDRWILDEAETVFKEVWEDFGRREFYTGTHRLLNFINHNLSSIWMSAVKDRLYCGSGARRESAVATMQQILHHMMLVLSPIMTVTIDELCEHLPDWWFDWFFPCDLEGRGNVFQQDALNFLEERKSEFHHDYWVSALDEFNALFDTIKEEGHAKDKLEMAIVRGPTDGDHPAFSEVENWFGVAEFLDAAPGQDIEGLGYTVRQHYDIDGETFVICTTNKHKCPRCWKRNTTEEDTLCERCYAVVDFPHPMK